MTNSSSVHDYVCFSASVQLCFKMKGDQPPRHSLGRHISSTSSKNDLFELFDCRRITVNQSEELLGQHHFSRESVVATILSKGDNDLQFLFHRVLTFLLGNCNPPLNIRLSYK